MHDSFHSNAVQANSFAPLLLTSCITYIMDSKGIKGTRNVIIHYSITECFHFVPNCNRII